MRAVVAVQAIAALIVVGAVMAITAIIAIMAIIGECYFRRRALKNKKKVVYLQIETPATMPALIPKEI